jgi:hypothetical protein
MELTRKEILALDPKLVSTADKKAYIDLLYGSPSEWTWKSDLELVSANMDRWKRFLANEPASGQPFHIGHQQLLRDAKRHPPIAVGGSVSNFTDWIYRLYVPQKDYANLVRGLRVERDIAIQKIQVPNHSRWKLIHNGMGDNAKNAFSITALTINGAPMRGTPDLVFQEKDTRRILIVEIKVTEKDIPSDGWPNMRAQLWAYSKIDKWKDAPEVILVGELWGFSPLRWRKVIRWRRGEKSFEQENTELFDCYRSFATPSFQVEC